MIYGQSFLNESVNRNRRDSSLSLLESVAFDEYQNRVAMLESCKDEHTRSLIEAQVEVLREVSLKDIKDKFLAFLKKIGDFIKKIIDKIKSFFNKDDKKKQEEELKAVKKKLEEANLMNEKLKKENDELKEKNASSDTIKQEEIKALTKKLNGVFSKAIENPLLYFNAYNYFRKDVVNPVEIARCNVFDDFSSGRDVEKYKRNIVQWLQQNSKNVRVVNDAVAKEIRYAKNNAVDINADYEIGFHPYTYAPGLKKYIEDDLQKRVKQAESCTFADVVKNITDVIGNNYEDLMETTVNFDRGIANTQKAIAKILSNKSDDEIQQDQDAATISGLRHVISMLKDSVACLSQITLYSAKANGAATIALKTAVSVMGIDKIKSTVDSKGEGIIDTALGNN